MENIPEMYRLNYKACKVCSHPDVAKVDEQFLKKEITQEEAAEKLGVSVSYYAIHVGRDVQRPIAERVSPVVELAVVDTAKQVQRMKGIFEKLITRCEDLLGLPLEDGVEGRIRLISSEARQMAEFLCKLEGKLTDSPAIQINMLNIRYTKLLQSVNEVVCPHCQAKLMKKLQELNRVKTKEIIDVGSDD